MAIKRKIGVFLVTMALFAAAGTFQGCKTSEIKRAQKEAWKVQKKSAKEEKKAHKADLKAHRKMQSKETLRMMKKTEKKSREYNRQFRKQFFLWRWLGFRKK